MEKVYSYMEAAIGLGTIIGPPLGSLLYNLFDFAPAFYCLSVIFSLAFFQTLIFIPNALNKSADDQKKHTEND